MISRTPTASRFALSLAAILVSIVPAFGHHSLAMFDQTQTATLTGTVLRFDLVNPHSWLYVNATDESGAEVTWGFESSSPSGLASNGWDTARISAGETVVVTFNPMKDGTNGGQLRGVVLSDGTEFCSGMRCRNAESAE